MSEIYIISKNGKLNCSNGTLNYTDYEGHSQTIFPHLTDSISSIGTQNISASALKILISKQIPVFFISRNGLPKGNLSFTFSKNVFLRQKQFTMLSDSLKRFDIAKSIVVGKLSNQRRFLQRCENCESAVDEMRYVIRKIETASDINELRGYEGVGAHIYFSALGTHIPD